MYVAPWVSAILLISAFILHLQHESIGALSALLAAVGVSRWFFRELPAGNRDDAAVGGKIHIGWLLLGLVSGWFGVRFLSGIPRWWEGGLLQAFSLYSLLRAFPAKSMVLDPLMPTPVPAATIDAAGSRSPTPYGAWFFFGVGTWALISSVSEFKTGALQPGLSLLVISFAALLAALLMRPSTRKPSGSLSSAWLWLVLAAAALMRFPFLGRDFTGLQIDEANHLIDGIRVMRGELYSPFMTGWWGNPSFVYFITGGFFKLFGVSLEAGRGLSALLSMVSLYLFYRLARFYVAPVASLLATLLFSFAWYHLFYSLSPFTDAYTLVFELAAFFFLERSLKEGRRGDFVWTGLFLAASVMSYISGRLAVPMVALSLGSRFLIHGRSFVKAYTRHLFLLFLSFLWLIGPFIYYSIGSPDEFWGRSKELSIFTEMQRTGDYWLPLKTFLGTAMSFYRLVDPDPRFGLFHVPVVDPVTAVFLTLGFGVTLIRFRSWLTWIILPGLFFSIIANSMAIQGENPSPWYMNLQRFYLVLPFAFLLVARGLEWFLDRLHESAGLVRNAAAWALAVSLGLSAYVNGRVYYHEISNNPSTWNAMAFSHQQATRLCMELFPTHHVLVDWEIFSSVGDLMTYGTGVQVTRIPPDLPVPVLRKAVRDVAFVFIHYRSQELQAKIRKVYPNAVWSEVMDPYGRPSLMVAKVSLQEFERVRGGLESSTPLP